MSKGIIQVLASPLESSMGKVSSCVLGNQEKDMLLRWVAVELPITCFKMKVRFLTDW